jgi:hypothetical protein
MGDGRMDVGDDEERVWLYCCCWVHRIPGLEELVVVVTVLLLRWVARSRTQNASSYAQKVDQQPITPNSLFSNSYHSSSSADAAGATQGTNVRCLTEAT